ncbi:outer membrane beta-barrel protein [Flectobacillus rivi]|uniref:Outer membrane beta-barrel protein n=1 Tax=Flectobacillus rivi TaxID=2984209 RepID=A0ABT6YWB3_9BACT|nr:outer membrane beta-barrel protein [Flectobacillus rivi]MDI9873104.1 outer membrane beta-barrel protein [Flectobacillus rivi]
MKILFLTCLTVILLMVHNSSQAQYDPGTKYWVVGGGLIGNFRNAFTSSQALAHEQNLNLHFKFGKFGDNKVSRGWLADYTLEWHESSSSSKYGSHSIGAGYFINKFQPLNKNIGLYAEASGIGRYLLTRSNNGYKSDGFHASIQANVGLRYHFKSKLFLDCSANIGSVNYQKSDSQPAKTENFYVALSPNIGSFKIAIGKTL